METIRVLVTGSRGWTDTSIIHKKLVEVAAANPGKRFLLIHGGCRGADLLTKIEALRLGWTDEVYTPNWEKYGRSAGLRRNVDMLVLGKPDTAIAFCLDRSPGTMHCIREIHKHKRTRNHALCIHEIHRKRTGT